MTKPLGGFRAALLAGWVALGATGILYTRTKGIPIGTAMPVLAAFLVSYPFYLFPAFSALRERLAGVSLFLYLASSAALPYLVCCLGAVQFQWLGLGKLLAMAAVFGIWYYVFPAKPLPDLLLLTLIAAVLLGKYFNSIYIPRVPALKDIIVLGHLSLIEIAVVVLLQVRHVKDFGYGFLPNRREWRIGALNFLYFVAIGLPLALALKAIHVNAPAPLWKITGTFFGVLWVLALSEEFFFRGVLQQWIEDWTGNWIAALVTTSAIFGLVHIGFGGRFPNWRWVAVVTILGLCCGHARNQAGSIRAGMVTHALVVTTWRAFFA